MAAISNGHQERRRGHHVSRPLSPLVREAPSDQTDNCGSVSLEKLRVSNIKTQSPSSHFSSHWHRHKCGHRRRGRRRSEARGCGGQRRRRRGCDKGGGVRGADTGLGALLVSAAIPRGGDRGLRRLWSRDKPSGHGLRWTPGQININSYSRFSMIPILGGRGGCGRGCCSWPGHGALQRQHGAHPRIPGGTQSWPLRLETLLEPVFHFRPRRGRLETLLDSGHVSRNQAYSQLYRVNYVFIYYVFPSWISSDPYQCYLDLIIK